MMGELPAHKLTAKGSGNSVVREIPCITVTEIWSINSMFEAYIQFAPQTLN
jgi:hypothetical protein